MSFRAFKRLFTAVFALSLGGFLFVAGLNIDRLPPIGILQSFTDYAHDNALWRQSTVLALAVLGLLLGSIIGPWIAQNIVNAGNAIERMSTRDKVAVGIGTFLGVVVSLPFLLPLLLSLKVAVIGVPISVLVCVAFVYLGIRAMMSMKDELRFIGGQQVNATESSEESMDRCKILDTNVIIDGRISDICRSGFIEGPIYIPGFVLDELHHIADSSDSLKRARGRRGLDILNAMQKEFALVVRSYDYKLGNNGGAPDEVDTRLVRLAKSLGGSIVTNDFNLNKVAALQGVTVLNVNELANALKPVVLPGEEMPVNVIKEGKEQNQGVAYLDDGTMIVIEDGRRHIGEHLDVIVTSVLQTVAGKMIFARIRNTAGDEDEGHGASTRSTSGRPRFKVR